MPRRRPVRPVPPACAEHRGRRSEPGLLTRGGRIPRGGARRLVRLQVNRTSRVKVPARVVLHPLPSPCPRTPKPRRLVPRIASPLLLWVGPILPPRRPQRPFSLARHSHGGTGLASAHQRARGTNLRGPLPSSLESRQPLGVRPACAAATSRIRRRLRRRGSRRRWRVRGRPPRPSSPSETRRR